MKFWILFFTNLFIFFELSAQHKHDVYMLTLSDKNQNPFSVFHPQEYLSVRAIERRNAQNISIDERDLPINPQYISKIEATGAKVVLKSKWLNAVAVHIKDKEVKNNLQNLNFVSSIIPIGSKRSPREPNLSDGLKNSDYKKEDSYYGATFNQIYMLSGQILHNLGHKGYGKQVAIFDGGFVNVYKMPVFDSLYQNYRILGTRDFVEGDDFVYEASNHGTNVLSCMAANLPYLLMGTAPSSSYYLFKTEDVGSEFRIEEFNWAAAAEYADSLGVDIINSSLGYTSFNDSTMNYSYLDMNAKVAISTRAADIAVEKGMLVVNSAGNEGDGTWRYIGTPADGLNVISVGAVRGNGSRASFSSFGPSADGRIKPNVSAQGSRVFVANSKGNGVSQTDGTSFSSPIMAGMISTLWSAFPYKSNWEIKDAVEAAGSQTLQPDNSLGYGIPDFFRAYLLLCDQITAISAEGELFDTKSISKDQFSLKIESIKQTVLRYKFYNKFHMILQEGSIETKPFEIDEIKITNFSSLEADFYYLKIESDDYTRYLKIIKAPKL